MASNDQRIGVLNAEGGICLAGRRTVMMPLRTAVVGAGYFGRFHARHYKECPGADLVAVVDVAREKADALAGEFGVLGFTDHRELAGRIDAASIAVPTSRHYEVARDLLEAGVHVLVEKPITSEVAEAAALNRLAQEKGLVLAVGHIERYSAPFLALADSVSRPLYIESSRISQWKPRATDVDVVLDLMIHDVDIILGLVKSRVARIDAAGAPVLNPTEDIASARIVFEDGCVANVTASRISGKTQRTMRVFQPDSYIVCDFGERRISRFIKTGDPLVQGPAAITADAWEVPHHDSLAKEIAEFVSCVRSGRTPTVDGRAGEEALKITTMINEALRKHRRQVAEKLAMSFV
jgi:predicted dehydrogenase